MQKHSTATTPYLVEGPQNNATIPHILSANERNCLPKNDTNITDTHKRQWQSLEASKNISVVPTSSLLQMADQKGGSNNALLAQMRMVCKKVDHVNSFLSCSVCLIKSMVCACVSSNQTNHSNYWH